MIEAEVPALALCLAGKSTLFNALTQAGTAAPGIAPAKTAAAPFTTIAPNVGPAWWAAPAQAEPEALVLGRTPDLLGGPADRLDRRWSVVVTVCASTVRGMTRWSHPLIVLLTLLVQD